MEVVMHEGMYKITEPGGWNFNAPIASLVEIHSKGIDAAWMAKTAAAGIFKQADLRPEPGHELIHLLAMGDAEAYGGNRNGDWFYGTPRTLDLLHPEWDKLRTKEGKWHQRSEDTFTDKILNGNAQRAETFTKFAHVFKNHKNKPHKGDKIYGSVKAAAHNPELARVELMIQVPRGKDWDSDLQKIANNEDIPFSMASKVPYDVCLTCGHKARNTDEYCQHAANYMTSMDKSGHVVGVANDHMTYFDISRVHRPADRIAWSLYGTLTKAAAARGHTKLAAELAQDPEYGFYPHPSVLAAGAPAKVREKMALLHKTAEIEKRVPLIAKSSPIVKGLAAKQEKLAMPHPDYERYRLPEYFQALADHAICLDMDQWSKVVLGPEKAAMLSDTVAAARESLPGAFTRALENYSLDVVGNHAYDTDKQMPNNDFRKMAEDADRSCGLTPTAVMHRAIVNICGGKVDNTKLTKQASSLAISDPAAEGLVRDYVSYKLAFLDEIRQSKPEYLDFVIEAAVLQHYL
jgi:hypothetical protein